MDIKILGGEYQRRARLYPVVLLFSPLIIAGLSKPAVASAWPSIGSTLAVGAAATFVSMVVRKRGQEVEERLVKLWGGLPSVIILRHSDSTINVVTKANVHRALAKEVPGTSIPTPQDEKDDPAKCEERYKAWSEHLRIKARTNQSAYPHVFNENCFYGFYRNMLGLKPTAICLLIASLAYVTWSGYLKWDTSPETKEHTMFSLCVIISALLSWILLVNSKGVRRCGFNYARRLIDDCISTPRPKGKKEPL